jgi:hypothetical protein
MRCMLPTCTPTLTNSITCIPTTCWSWCTLPSYCSNSLLQCWIALWCHSLLPPMVSRLSQVLHPWMFWKAYSRSQCSSTKRHNPYWCSSSCLRLLSWKLSYTHNVCTTISFLSIQACILHTSVITHMTPQNQWLKNSMGLKIVISWLWVKSSSNTCYQLCLLSKLQFQFSLLQAHILFGSTHIEVVQYIS